MVTGLIVVLGGGGSDEPGDGGPPAPSAGAALGNGELAGSRLIAGWDGLAPPAGLRELIANGSVAGLILFADNVESRSTIRRRLAQLQEIERPEALSEPLLVMVDQEGGPVRRLSGPPQASAQQMGERGADFARTQGEETALSLLGVGVGVDLAPVLDVAVPGGAIDREGRAFGRTAEQVTEAGVDGFAAGIAGGGAVATAKHFPGLGSAGQNTDLSAETIDRSLRRLREVDEAPFAAFVEAGGELVMISLATYPALAARPAAFSSKVVEGELRERLGFSGVTISDGLGAAAAAAFGNPRQIALAAEGAGVDLLLYSDWRAARDAARLFRRGLRAGELPRERFEQAAERVLALRARLAQTSG